MTPLVHLVPVAIAAASWLALERLNRRLGWLRRGEIIFWDAILLVIIFLIWLRWF